MKQTKRKFVKIAGVIVICFFAFACKEKVTKFYYNTGELYMERFDVGKDSAYYYDKSYYRNGQLKDKGYTLKDNKPQGHWMSFYSDGYLKWEGDFSNGYRVYKNIDYTKLPVTVSSKDDSCITINKPFEFRIYIEGIHPEDYIVTKDILGEVKVSDIYNDDYPYTLVLTEKELDIICEYRTYPRVSRDSLIIAVHLLPYIFEPDTTKRKTYNLKSLPMGVCRVPIKRE